MEWIRSRGGCEHGIPCPIGIGEAACRLECISGGPGASGGKSRRRRSLWHHCGTTGSVHRRGGCTFWVQSKPGAVSLGAEQPVGTAGLLESSSGSQELRAALVGWTRKSISKISQAAQIPGARTLSFRGSAFLFESGGLVAQMEQRFSGWESVVLYSAEDGAYRLSAYDPEHAVEASSQALGQSMATMILWSEQGSFMESVNPGIPANLWHALDYHPKSEEVLRLQQLRTGVESREEILLDGG